jgi:hypothetical protein
MAKSGCGQFVGLASIYSNDALHVYQISIAALKESDKRYANYKAKVKSSGNSKSYFTEYEQGCECAANYIATTNGSYNSDANSSISASVDNYGSIIIKNAMDASANLNGSENMTDNTSLLYCAPDPSVYFFSQSGSNNCTNNQGTTAYECKGECKTTETKTVLKKEGKKWVKTTETYSSDDPCVGEPAYSPSAREDLGWRHDTDTENSQSYSKNESHNDEWKSTENCAQGSYNYTSNSNIDITVKEIVTLSKAQNLRRQAIDTRLGIYEKNGPQNKNGAKCIAGHISPNEYACWDFFGIDQNLLYVEEEYYSWKVRFKAFVNKEGLPTDVATFKANVHLYSIPAAFDAYGEPLLPYTGISNCNCGSKTAGGISPFKKLSVSVPRDGEIVNWFNSELIVGNGGDVDSSQAPIQESFIFYCVEDTTYQ